MTSPHILIAGAGIGGLVAALACLRQGHDVSVYEQAPELKELGAGVQLSANGTRVLIDLGLGPAMEEVACAPVRKEVRLWNTGRTWKLLDLGEVSVARWGAPYWVVHRGDLHRILADAVHARAPGAIHLNSRATGYTQDADGVTLQLADGSTAHGDVLVGADGVHSAIRQQMYGDTKAHFLGIAAWRGLVPIESLPSHLQAPVGSNFVGPGGHIVTYPVRAGTLLNAVGVLERDNWPVESWTEAGTHEEMLADFTGWHDDILTIMRAIETPYKWALLGRDPLERYTDGRVLLLGDAAHPTLPFLAQGANMAIEDGMVLSRCLADSGTVQQALRRYDAARVTRTTAIVNGSTDNARRFHNPTMADPEQAAEYVDREWQPEKIEKRYNWLFEYNPMTVPV
jgi:salicylate hydroxylase